MNKETMEQEHPLLDARKSTKIFGLNTCFYLFLLYLVLEY